MLSHSPVTRTYRRNSYTADHSELTKLRLWLVIKDKIPFFKGEGGEMIPDLNAILFLAPPSDRKEIVLFITH